MYWLVKVILIKNIAIYHQNKMAVKLFKYQEEVIQKLDTGSILCGGVGSGKSITAIAYYFVKENGGKLNPFKKLEAKKPLYIITTAGKRGLS